MCLRIKVGNFMNDYCRAQIFLQPVYFNNHKDENCCQRFDRCAQDWAIFMQLTYLCLKIFDKNEKKKTDSCLGSFFARGFQISNLCSNALDLLVKVKLQCSYKQSKYRFLVYVLLRSYFVDVASHCQFSGGKPN